MPLKGVKAVFKGKINKSETKGKASLKKPPLPPPAGSLEDVMALVKEQLQLEKVYETIFRLRSPLCFYQRSLQQRHLETAQIDP
jgi:hypothetical protein